MILPAFKQESSYFAIQNEHWLLVGLDTAYVDHDIDTTQVAWLNLDPQSGRHRARLVLFSHQQPFSRLDAQGPKLQKGAQAPARRRADPAWYWGHEHECMIYDEHPAWGLFGRCLGNGGVPSARKKDVRRAPADPRPAAWRLRLAAARRHGRSPCCIVLDGPNLDMEDDGPEEVRPARLHDARVHGPS